MEKYFGGECNQRRIPDTRWWHSINILPWSFFSLIISLAPAKPYSFTLTFSSMRGAFSHYSYFLFTFLMK